MPPNVVPLLLLASGLPADLTLTGVVLSEVRERSVALLRSAKRGRAAAVGERAFGGIVVEVTPAGAVLDFDGRRVVLALPAAAAVSPPPPSPEAPSVSYERAKFERRLAGEIPGILAGTRLTPRYQESQVIGLELSELAPGTLLSELGLRRGDVLSEVNGIPIDGFATLGSLWTRLHGESSLSAVVLRGGTPVSLAVRLR